MAGAWCVIGHHTTSPPNLIHTIQSSFQLSSKTASPNLLLNSYRPKFTSLTFMLILLTNL